MVHLLWDISRLERRRIVNRSLREIVDSQEKTEKKTERKCGVYWLPNAVSHSDDQATIWINADLLSIVQPFNLGNG